MSEKKVYLIAHHETSYVPPYDRHHGRERYKKYADYYKIGVASNVDKRLSILNGGTPHQLELITTIESSDAEALETALHDYYYSKHKTGEWYNLTTNDVNSLKAFQELEAKTVLEARKLDLDWQVPLYVRVGKARKSRVEA